MDATPPTSAGTAPGEELPWLGSMLRAAGLGFAAVARSEPLRPGLGGGRLWRVWLRAPIALSSGPPDTRRSGDQRYGAVGAYWSAQRIVKAIAPMAGWLSVASADTHVREVTLWSSGLLAALPHGIRTGVVAWQDGRDGRDGQDGQDGQDAGDRTAPPGLENADTWSALLMRDETARLWRRPLRTPPGRLPVAIVTLLDDLARLHARFWNDSRLDDAHAAAIGLTPLRATLLMASPTTVAERLALGDANPYLPLAHAGWEAFFALADPTDAATLTQVFAAPEPYVAAMAALPRTLIHGDVWGPNIGRLPPTHRAPRRGRATLLIDWALAAAAPATFDPLWFCGVWQTLAPQRILGAYRARLARHLAARGITIPAHVWRALADAAYLRTTLISGEAFGRVAREAPAGAAGVQAERRARWWAARAAQAARRLL